MLILKTHTEKVSSYQFSKKYKVKSTNIPQIHSIISFCLSLGGGRNHSNKTRTDERTREAKKVRKKKRIK